MCRSVEEGATDYRRPMRLTVTCEVYRLLPYEGLSMSRLRLLLCAVVLGLSGCAVYPAYPGPCCYRPYYHSYYYHPYYRPYYYHPYYRY